MVGRRCRASPRLGVRAALKQRRGRTHLAHVKISGVAGGVDHTTVARSEGNRHSRAGWARAAHHLEMGSSARRMVRGRISPPPPPPLAVLEPKNMFCLSESLGPATRRRPLRSFPAATLSHLLARSISRLASPLPHCSCSPTTPLPRNCRVKVLRSRALGR